MIFSKPEKLSRFEFGKLAEEQAKRYLKKQGYQFVEANFFTKEGEIDLIFNDGEILVFVEVRAKRKLAFGSPEESITENKIMRCKKAANKYIYDKAQTNRACRFDVVTLVYEKNKWKIMHYKDAFE